MKNRAWLGAIVVAGAMALAACSSSPTTAVASGSPSPSDATSPASVAPSSAPQGSNPGATLCVLLKAENKKFADLGKTFGTALSSSDYSTTKATLVAYFAEVATGLAEVQGAMSSAPADVQAALAVSNKFFAQLQSKVAAASTLQELETSISSLSATPQVKAAGKTLDNYVKSQCGDITASP